MGFPMDEASFAEIQPLGKTFFAFLVIAIWGMFVLARRRRSYHLRIDKIHWVAYCVIATILLAMAVLGFDFMELIRKFLD